jgi:hypothetical protein
VAARRGILSSRIQLCRALGGAWTTDLELPADMQEDDEDDEGGEKAPAIDGGRR